MRSIPVRRPGFLILLNLFSLLLLSNACRPETLLVYEIKPPEKVDGWKLFRFDRGTSLRAEAEFENVRLNVVVARLQALEELGQRLSERRERGRLDVQPIRIMIHKDAGTDVALNFSDFVIVKNGNSIPQIDYATFIKEYAAPGLLDYEWTFGQKYLTQFQLEEPDWMQEREDDTASPLEKRERLAKKLASYKPWAPPVLRAGEAQAGWILFPQLDAGQDYTLEYRPNASGRRLSIPILPFRVQMERKQLEILGTDSDEDKEVRKLFQKDREAINRANEEFVIMHKQLRNHDTVTNGQASKKIAP
ncbi:MAG: hypothetical protein K8S54_09370 [Spirochaetia bacterium]|nr:hypothetical protein [Spirochaetia bacterium]